MQSTSILSTGTVPPNPSPTFLAILFEKKPTEFVAWKQEMFSTRGCFEAECLAPSPYTH